MGEDDGTITSKSVSGKCDRTAGTVAAVLLTLLLFLMLLVVGYSFLFMLFMLR